MSAKRPSPSVPHMKHQEPGIAVLVGLKGQTVLKGTLHAMHVHPQQCRLNFLLMQSVVAELT